MDATPKYSAFDRPMTPPTPTRPRRKRTAMSTGGLRLRANLVTEEEVVEVIAVCDCCENKFEIRRNLLKAFEEAINDPDSE